MRVYWVTNIWLVVRFTCYPQIWNCSFVNIDFLRLILKNRCRYSFKEFFVSFPNTRYVVQEKNVPVDGQSCLYSPTHCVLLANVAITILLLISHDAIRSELNIVDFLSNIRTPNGHFPAADDFVYITILLLYVSLVKTYGENSIWV